MGKVPGRNQNSTFRRRPQPGRVPPSSGKPLIHREPGKGPSDSNGKRKLPQNAMIKAFERLQVFVVSTWNNVRPPKGAVHNRQGRKAIKKRRYVIYAGSVAIVVVIALLVLLVPGGFAAPAASATASPTPVLTPEPTIDVVGTPVPTTVAEVTASPTPTATPKPSPTPTATPKPSPTATATAKPTATPSPAPDISTLVAYYVEEADTYYDKIGYSNNHYEYTDEELLMLAKIIQTEAGGESDKGKIAVGNVVMNRVLSGQWGSTIDAVKGGFAYHEDTVPKQKSIDAAHAVLDDEIWVVPQNTYHFKTSGGDWRDFTYYGQIGNHYFYTRNFSTRYNGDGIPDALYARVYKYAQYGCKPSQRVYRIQYMLKSLGYDVKQADKYFGMGTKEALIKFQKDKGLKADGIAGPATMKALIRAFGVDAYCDKFG